MKNPLPLPLHRRQLLQAGFATGLGLLLPAARACEFFTTTLRITHPWTRASAPQAGSAVICMKFDEVRRTDRLIRLETPVAAGAEMGGAGHAGHRSGVNFLIPAGLESELSEGGTYVRLLGLRHALELGLSYPLTLYFEQGGRVEADLSIDFESLPA
jgi:copper(I)-binding protein